MKKGLIIVNSFNKTNSYLYQVTRLRDEFLKFNVLIDIKRTSELDSGIEGGKVNNKIIQGYDFVIFQDKDTVISRIIEKSGIRVFNNSSAIEYCDNKFLTHVMLANNNISMPITYPSLLCYSNYDGLEDEYIAKILKNLQFPIIFKLCYGSLGKNVFLLNNKEELLEHMKKYRYQSYLIQEFIKESFGKDIRIIVIGNRVIAAMERKNNNDFRSNVGHGGYGRKIEISKELEELALKVAHILNLDFCGIDILIGKDKYFLCEVNSNAFFQEIEKVSEKNIAYEYMKYIYDIIYK